ncbi:MAG: FAD:protein FMN transferase [Pseudohongiellaceae bacterium]|nr:FAD:protein FMN transferase [Pseudohongiellaceae bacterium]
MNTRFRSIGALALLLIVGVGLWARLQNDSSAQLYELNGHTMGTTYSIKLLELPAAIEPDAFAAEIEALLFSLDKQIMSTYAPESELSVINRAPVGEALAISSQMNDVLSLALELSELTDGAFDVTVGPLVNRWGFGPTAMRTQLPSDAEIAQLRERVGYDKIVLDQVSGTLTKLSDVYIDLSGIAKGYAVDRVAALFDSYAVASYFIEIGGELRIKGYKPNQQSWVPAIEKPVDTAPQVHNIFYANGRSIAVAGSGDYRNYFEQNGVHYSHEIDPKTGRPVTHNLAAVYVIDETAARADALATAFMVMGGERGRAFAQQQGLAVYFISKRSDAEGFEDYFTKAFEQYLEPQ